MPVDTPAGYDRTRRWGAWPEYTATWSSASNPQPAIGNGTVKAWARRDGSIGWVQFAITPGSTTTYGTGAWALSLPTGWNAASETNRYQRGVLMLNDTGTAVYDGHCYVVPGGAAILLRYGSPWSNVQSNQPFTWTNGDFLSGEIELALTDPTYP